MPVSVVLNWGKLVLLFFFLQVWNAFLSDMKCKLVYILLEQNAQLFCLPLINQGKQIMQWDHSANRAQWIACKRSIKVSLQNLLGEREVLTFGYTWFHSYTKVWSAEYHRISKTDEKKIFLTLINVLFLIHCLLQSCIFEHIYLVDKLNWSIDLK